MNSPSGTTYPAYYEVARVYQSYINAQGGILGHPLKFIYCDNQNDPNGPRARAKDVLSDHLSLRHAHTWIVAGARGEQRS